MRRKIRVTKSVCRNTDKNKILLGSNQTNDDKNNHFYSKIAIYEEIHRYQRTKKWTGE